jgi:hypothetical protein
MKSQISALAGEKMGQSIVFNTRVDQSRCRQCLISFCQCLEAALVESIECALNCKVGIHEPEEGFISARASIYLHPRSPSEFDAL